MDGQHKQGNGAIKIPGEGVIYDPYTVSLHLTDICNSSCIFCGEDSHHRPEDTVKTEKLVEFLEDNRGGKWTTVNIHGGEPTVRKDFLQLLSKIRELGYQKIILQSNALKMADENFARKVHEVGVDIFTSGFHGHTPELVKEITRVSRGFELALKGFENIKKGGARLRITIVACRQNYKYLKEICQVGIDHGVDHINLSAMQPGGTAEDNLDHLLVSYSEAYPYIKEAIDFSLQQEKIVTLEGFPYCVLPAYERNQINWKKQRLKVLYRDMVINDFNGFLNKTMRTKEDVCRKCLADPYCCGFYTNYLSYYGHIEFRAYPEKEGV